MMSKFIVIPEPHISYNNIEGRKDYISEIKYYLNDILEDIKENKDIKWVVFVGDVFNRGFNDVDEYFYWIDWFTELDKMLSLRGGCIYSVIGNHELTYAKSNPFWRLTSKDDGGFNITMNWHSKVASPKGLRSLIKVEDIVEMGDKTSLFFCHYDGIEHCKN